MYCLCVCLTFYPKEQGAGVLRMEKEAWSLFPGCLHETFQGLSPFDQRGLSSIINEIFRVMVALMNGNC